MLVLPYFVFWPSRFSTEPPRSRKHCCSGRHALSRQFRCIQSLRPPRKLPYVANKFICSAYQRHASLLDYNSIVDVILQMINDDWAEDAASAIERYRQTSAPAAENAYGTSPRQWHVSAANGTGRPPRALTAPHALNLRLMPPCEIHGKMHNLPARLFELLEERGGMKNARTRR